MKPILLVTICCLFACSEPNKIKLNPDDPARTSGTLGSSKATNQVPNQTMDTTIRKDSTLKRNKH